MFQKKCKKCGTQFMRLGGAPGNCGLLGRLLGMLVMFFFFGGTSKYCQTCRAAVKQETGKEDKDLRFRAIWFVVAVIVLFIIIKIA